MPQRQYFYTPIATEDHHIGATDVNGDYIASSAMTPGASNPAVPLEIVSVCGDQLICLRVDVSSGRCVVSMPQTVNQVYIEGNTEELSILNGEWQQVSRVQIESDYQNGDPNADDALIDFSVEGE